MLKHSTNLDGEFLSPLSQGRIDRNFENLVIKMIHVPVFEDFIKTAILTEYGSSGGGKGESMLTTLDALDSNKLLAQTSEKFMHGGLYQFLESDSVSFLIYGCSRAFTHEMVRTRKGAWFVQQTMRHSDMYNANVRMPQQIVISDNDIQKKWIDAVKKSIDTYIELTRQFDIPYQDARTVLPLATETWIIVGMPIRTFLETYNFRACSMFYPEMVYCFREMGRLLSEKCNWLEPKIKISCEIPDQNGEHWCYYRGTEQVEGFCTFPWAQEKKRLFKSKLYNR